MRGKVAKSLRKLAAYQHPEPVGRRRYYRMLKKAYNEERRNGR